MTSVKSRAAQIGDKLITKDFGTGTRGFCAEGEEDCAICVLPGTEIAFEAEVKLGFAGLFGMAKLLSKHRTAIFRQINKTSPHAHHDAIEFPNGEIKLLTSLAIGQKARVLQMPAPPKTKKEAEDQKRLVVTG